MPQFKLKWTPDDPSDSVILTWDGSWIRRIIQGSFTYEFRKTGPTKLTPTSLYAYVTLPIRAIVAKFVVVQSGQMSVGEALMHTHETLFSEAELRSYAGDAYDILYFYHLGRVEVAHTPIEFQHLHDAYDYWPSSNFFPLSATGRDTLDSLGSFVDLSS